MILYRARNLNDSSIKPIYYTTKGDARKLTKEAWPAQFRPSMTVEQIDIKVTRDDLVAIMNGSYEVAPSAVIGRWGMNTRGALVDL